MRVQEAIELIQPAVRGGGGAWADLGAGTGLFSRALATLLGPAARVVAVDRDQDALAALLDSVRDTPLATRIRTARADFQDADAVAAVAGAPLDGVLLANALHFAPRQEVVLAGLARLLAPAGRLVVVEYDGRGPSRWVPHPVSIRRLSELAAQLSMPPPRVVGERASAYGGTMYCAVLTPLQRHAG